MAADIAMRSAPPNATSEEAKLALNAYRLFSRYKGIALDSIAFMTDQNHAYEAIVAGVADKSRSRAMAVFNFLVIPRLNSISD